MALDDVINLKIDDDGDLVVLTDSNGLKDFRRITGNEAIQQNVQVRILTPRSQRVLHPDYGFNFKAIETLFDANLVRGEMARTILDDPDMAEIADFDIEFTGRTRHALYRGEVRTQDGDLIPVAGST